MLEPRLTRPQADAPGASRQPEPDRPHPLPQTWPLTADDTLRHTQQAVHAARAELQSLQVALAATRDALRRRQAALKALDVPADAGPARQAGTDMLPPQQQDAFLAMLAHELRNPLAGMNNALHVLQHPAADAAARREAFAVLARQLGNQARMVDDLLDVSRVTRGLVALRREPMDLATVVRNALALLRSQIAARGHAVALHLPATPLLVDGDPVRLEQVVSNLLGNAVKYTPPHGSIDIALRREGDAAVLTLQDNGIGMTPRLAADAFDIFVRSQAAVQQDSGGLGIGLAVVRLIVELHGGTVQAHSDGPARGSRFVVRLPARTQDQPLPDDAAGCRRLLVVDDNADAAEGTAALMALEGFSCRTAADGPTALQLAASFHPDAVLLDLGLPGMDGHTLCRRLRALQPALRIIVLTGAGDADAMARSQAAGADHHLVKPTAPARLVQLLHQGHGGGPATAAPPSDTAGGQAGPANCPGSA